MLKGYIFKVWENNIDELMTVLIVAKTKEEAEGKLCSKSNITFDEYSFLEPKVYDEIIV